MKILKKAAAIAFWLLMWQIVYMAVNKEILLVSPITVFRRIGELIGTAYFWQAVGGSFLRIFSGILIGTAAGAGLAAVCFFVPILDTFIEPAVKIIRSVPVVSFILLALVWIETSKVPVLVVVLILMPVVWQNTKQGLKAADPQLLEMAQTFELSALSRIRNIYIPSVAPYFMAACVSAIGLAWKAGITAEVLAIPRGSVGREMYNAKIYLDTADMFSWTLVIVVLSIILEYSVKAFAAKISKTGKGGRTGRLGKDGGKAK